MRDSTATPLTGTVSSGNVVTTDVAISYTDEGGNSLDIPAGTSVDFPDTAPQEITMDKLLDFDATTLPPNSEDVMLSIAFDLGPSGTTFSTPATLTITYTDADVAGLDEANLRVFEFDSSGNFVQELTVTFRDTANNIIKVEVTSFSVIALGGIPLLSATVDIDPDTLNKKSKGQYLNCLIELPTGYDVANINLSTVQLSINGSSPLYADPVNHVLGDKDGDGIADLSVKFDRASAQTVAPGGDAVAFVVKGSLTTGATFQGTDNIRVMDKGVSHIDQADHSSVQY